MPVKAMALEEAVLRFSRRAADQRDRAAENMRQHEIADQGVVDRDVELGRAGFAEQPARRIGDRDARKIGIRDQPLAPGGNRGGELDIAKPLENGVAERIVGRAVGIVNMRREHRPDPDDVLWRALEFGCAGTQRLQPRKQLLEHVCVEARSDLAAILQFAIHPFAERQRGKAFGSLGDGVSGNHEVTGFPEPWSWSRFSTGHSGRGPRRASTRCPQAPFPRPARRVHAHRQRHDR